MVVFASLILLACFGLAIGIFGFTMSIVWHLAAGLVIGALGRLVLPGEERISLLGTAFIGMAGSLIGHMIGSAMHLGGGLTFGIAVAAAAGLLSVLGFGANARR